MFKPNNQRKTFAILLAGGIVLCTLAIGYLLFFAEWPQVDAPEANPPPVASRPSPAPPRSVPPVPQTEPAPLKAAATLPPPPTLPGEEQISSLILREDLSHAEVAKSLFLLLPGQPPELQQEAAQHISNLTADKDVAIWLPDLVQGKIPKDASEVFFNDLLNRPGEINLMALAEMGTSKNRLSGRERAVRPIWVTFRSEAYPR